MSLPILPSPRVPNLLAWPDKGFHAAWLGHSTVLMKLNGYTVLTDPVFSDRAGLDLILFTAGVKRIVAPAVPLSALPPIDLILISHAHMDHLDTPTLKKLENKRTEVIMAPRTSDLIREKRFAKVTELMWDEEGQAGPVTVRAFEVNHWGARMQTDTYRGYNGYTLEAGGRRILFAGDTAITDAFRSVRAGRPIDLAIMPIGAYNPWIRYHCNPEQAWLMGNDAGAEFFMPVHHKTFRLSREPEGEPIERFVAAAAGRPERVVSRGVGEEFHWS
ncbi:MAG: MBL fold metallo-hydrolase [Candidatus Solibacter usitatus]|nr:MBL fold metallo-hydrolase [Candidatus Solibacter usitatus]